MEALERYISVAAWLCDNGNRISNHVRKGVKGMPNYFNVCEHCGGALDPGEKCDCQKMKNRNYTSIEGAGYKPAKIQPIGYKAKKTG